MTETVSAATARALLNAKSKFNKYGVASQVDRTYRGVVYRSKVESLYARHLDALLLAGEVVAWNPKPAPFPLVINGRKVGRYTPDFTVQRRGGAVEYHEVKGYAVRDWTLRYKVFLALYPDVVLVVIQARDVPKMLR